MKLIRVEPFWGYIVRSMLEGIAIACLAVAAMSFTPLVTSGAWPWVVSSTAILATAAWVCTRPLKYSIRHGRQDSLQIAAIALIGRRELTIREPLRVSSERRFGSYRSVLLGADRTILIPGVDECALHHALLSVGASVDEPQ